MKKLLALVLTLCLLCGVTALAENTTIDQNSESKSASTTVSYTIAACDEYTVTIPSAVTMSGSPDNISGSVTIKLNTEKFNVTGKKITVKLTKATFNLVNGENKISYTLKIAGKEYKLNDTVIEWTYGDNNNGITETLIAQAYPKANLPAGNYTDTLTFTVEVIDSTVEE